MKKQSILLFLFGIVCLSVSAQITWADNISHIFYAHCTSCHHNGGVGGFSLMTYNDASVSYIDIASSVNSKEMPPWKPDPNYRHFKDENVLSQSEIDDINAWVANGKPEGNPANAPTPPTYSTGSALAQVDETLQIPTYTISGNTDSYRSFVIPFSGNTDRFLNQIEYVPGNTAVVHHVVFYYDPTNSSAMLDQLDPGPGFSSFGSGPLTSSGVWIGAWAPGQRTVILPPNMGMRIPAGADFIVEIHYAPNSQGQTDNTSVNLAYTPTNVGVREAFTLPIMNYQNDITDGPLFIPANTVKTFHQENGSGGTDLSMIAIFPHMHKVGASYKVYSQKNNVEIPLIDIPKWDFYWQGYYTFQSLIKIPAGSKFHGIATYDNTTNNPDNPSNPPQDVSAGENTKDEMMITFATYTPYQTGDENIILDSALLNTAIFPTLNMVPLTISPNPVKDKITISLPIKGKEALAYTITDAVGKVVLSEKNIDILSNKGDFTIDMQPLTSGTYFLRVTNGQYYGVKKIIKE